VRFTGDDPTFYGAETIQRRVEGQNLDTRLFLDKYESVIEGQRQRIQRRRDAILHSPEPEFDRMVSLRAIDDLWSQYLETVSELRSSIHWHSYTGHDPLYSFLTKVDETYRELEERIDPEIAECLEEARANGADPSERGATWTYLTTDNPFGGYTERIVRGIKRKIGTRQLWG
jgi:preprotein translocase subunit SecA